MAGVLPDKDSDRAAMKIIVSVDKVKVKIENSDERGDGAGVSPGARQKMLAQPSANFSNFLGMG